MTSLHFSPFETSHPIKAEVSTDFWSVLLAEPYALANFRAEVPHLGAPVTLVFGCEDGEIIYRERPDTPAPVAPPDPNEQRDADLEFYDSLGDERPNTKCKSASCSRGTVPLSVFCRVHHFEMVLKRKCPFEH